MKLPKRSFLLSVSFTFLMAYAVLDITHLVVSNLAYYDKYQHERMLDVVNLARLGTLLLGHDEARYLEDRLKEARTLHQIDFFLLKKNGSVLSFGVPGDRLESIDSGLPEHGGEMVVSGDAPHVAFSKGAYFLTLGIYQRKSEYLRLIVAQNRVSLIFDITIVVLMASGIAFFFFGDIRTLLKMLRSPGLMKAKVLQPGLAEADLMLKGLKGYEAHLTLLQRQHGLLRHQINSAVQTELQSGRTPPYQFRCTMVRTDINQYSTIYSEHPVEDFMSVINEFFTRASRVIARYNGYITDFVGDEIIFYFKDQDHANSASIALAAVRDINEIASDIHLKTQSEMGYPFTVKSAIACGSLRFGPHVSGFALSGGVFVETVRILSQVEEKSENSVYVPLRLVCRLSDLCKTEERKTVELKGLRGAIQLHKVTTFVGPSESLASLTKTGADRFVHYRGARDVVLALRTATTAPDDVAMALLKALAAITLPFEETEVKAQYLSFVRGLLQNEKRDSVLLSFSIALSQRLIPIGCYDAELQKLFKECLLASDRRVIANTVDSFIHFDPLNREEVLIELLRHSDNRVLANTLIKIGMVDLGRQVIAGLHSLLKSPDPRFVASGAYAVGTLAAYHRSENPIVLETHKGLLSLLRRVEGLVDHPHPMVQRQARMAAKLPENDAKAA